MSAELAVIYHGVKTGARVVTIALRYLNDTDDSLLPEIAKVNYKSAMQASEAAEKMTDAERRNTELQGVIFHLRNVFNAYQESVSKKRNPISAFTASAAITEKKASQLSRSIDVAALIAVTYAELGEEPNAKEWRDRAREQFTVYEPVYRKFAKGQSYLFNPDPHRKLVFDEHGFQERLRRLESERAHLEQIFQARGIA